MSLNNLRRRRRLPLDETLPDGTPASDVLLPPVLRRPVPLEGEPAPRRIFSAGAMPAEMPTEAMPLARRTLDLNAPAPVLDEAPELAPIPPLARRRVTPPTFERTGDEQADLSRYQAGLRGYQNPEDNNGRLKSFGLGALRGALRGLATGGIGGAIGGALAGGIHGGVSPNLDEREARDEELARTGQRLGALNEQADAALTRRGKLASVTKTEAEASNLRNPRPPKPDFQLRDGEDGVYAVNMADPAAPPIKLPIKLKGSADSYDIYDDGSKVWAVNKRNPRDRYPLDDVATKPRPQMVERVLSDGTRVQVPATAALSAETQTEAANITAGNQYGNQTYEDTVRQQERQHGQTLAQWEAAGREQARLVKALDELNEAVAKRDAAARDAADPNLDDAARKKAEADRRYWDEQGVAKQRTVGTISSSISGSYGDFVENDQNGWPTRLKPRPAAPSLPSRPAPQRRSASTAPRQSGTVRNATPSGVMSVIERIRSRR